MSLRELLEARKRAAQKSEIDATPTVQEKAQIAVAQNAQNGADKNAALSRMIAQLPMRRDAQAAILERAAKQATQNIAPAVKAPASMSSRLAALKAMRAQTTVQPDKTVQVQHVQTAIADAVAKTTEDPNAIVFNGITFNARQSDAIRLARENCSFVLVGSAGTGKTTTVQAIVYEKLQLLTPEQIALVAYTNRATRNIRKACKNLPGKWGHIATQRCMTIHKFLDYRPVPYSYVTEKGELVESKRFEPTYHMHNQRPDIKLIVVDEASMVEIDLFRDLYQAHPNAIFIYIGDLNQLLPVFGDPILAYKLMEHPVIELEEVYRQAMDSPIVKFQYDYTLKGIPPREMDLRKYNEECPEQLRFVSFSGQYKDPVTKKMEDLNDRDVAFAIAQFMKSEFDAGRYNPATDVLLMPYGKAVCGAEETGRWIAQWNGERMNAKVHEIICNFEKRYFAVGDFITYDKEEWVITGIAENPNYSGPTPTPASVDLMRNGFHKESWHGIAADVFNEDDPTKMSFEELLEVANEERDGTRSASHVLELCPMQAYIDDSFESSDLVKISGASDIANCYFSYATTVYKAQGSEWRRVYIAFLRNHKAMLTREQLYTAMTRARESLICIYSPEKGALSSKPKHTIAKCITSPEVPGYGWQVKVHKFKKKVEEYHARMNRECKWGTGI